MQIFLKIDRESQISAEFLRSTERALVDFKTEYIGDEYLKPVVSESAEKLNDKMVVEFINF